MAAPVPADSPGCALRRHPTRTTPPPRSSGHAPAVPVAGTAEYCPPIQEQIYRVLCALERQGLVKRGSAPGREVTWLPAPNPADREIAALEATFTDSTTVQRADRPAIARASEHLSAGARCAHRIAIDGDDHTAAATLSHVLIHCADLLAHTTTLENLPAVNGGGGVVALRGNLIDNGSEVRQ